jgi:hypothetical protein
MLGTPSARELAARLELHRSGREWRGNCSSCGYADTFMTERRGRVLGWCASCQDQDFVTRLFRGEDCADAPAAQVTRAVEDACLRERALAVARHRREGEAS